MQDMNRHFYGKLKSVVKFTCVDSNTTAQVPIDVLFLDIREVMAILNSKSISLRIPRKLDR
jgi:hypothetical protein